MSYILIILDRILYTATHYPANYGFIPRTYGSAGTRSSFSRRRRMCTSTVR